MTTRTGTMTNEERLQRTIRLQPVDKMLSGPSISQFAATYAGITQKEFAEDPERAEAAYEKTFNELGGWDIGRFGGGDADTAGFATRRRLTPGRGLPDNVVAQIVEEEVMFPEDYDYVIKHGFNALQKLLSERVNPPDLSRDPAERERRRAEATRRARENTAKWLARGVARLSGGQMGGSPFAFFSYHRSISKFPLDVIRMPDKVKAAIKACIPDMIASARKGVAASGVRRVGGAGGSRGSSTFINAKQFEGFVLPSMLEMVYAMTDNDIDVVFHCDTDWTRFLPYFKEFPRGRCILQLDGATDIFKAGDILKNHMVIMGDVPSPLLTLGTPEDVFAYCKKLIEAYKETGGNLILSSGCSTPYNAKIENVAAMVRAGNELTWT